MLNSISLFSGYEGIGLGLQDYAKPILYCENAKFPQGILLSRAHEGLLPFAPIWPDVTSLDGKRFRGAVDLIHGGFPCQDISVAGTGKGLAGKRSGLFKEIIRIAEEARPHFIFLENVPNIRTKGAWIVQRELSRIGYDTRWTTISASQVGANHKRERWFCLATNTNSIKLWKQQGWGCGQDGEGKIVTGSNGEKESVANTKSCDDGINNPSKSKGQVQQFGIGSVQENFSNGNLQGLSGKTDASKKEDYKGKRKSYGWPMSSSNKCDWWEIEPGIYRVVDGDSFRLDEIKSILGSLGYWSKGIWKRVDQYFRPGRVMACGNGVVPLQAKIAFEILMGIRPYKERK